MTNSAPKTAAAASSPIATAASRLRPSPSTPAIRRPKVRALSAMLSGSRVRFERGVSGRVRTANQRATIPKGRLIRNSHRHDATARIAAATVGLPAEHTATTTATLPTPCPSFDEG